MAIQVNLSEWFDDMEERACNIDEKLDKFLNNTYKHMPGIYFGLIGFLIFTLSTLTAVVLYLSVDRSYSIITHWISNLGDGPNGANFVFNIGWIGSSGILFFFLVHEIRELRKMEAKSFLFDIMLLTAISFSGGLLLVGLFPMHLGLPHTIAALFYFIGGFTYFFFYGIMLLKVSDGGKIRSIFAFTTVAFHLLYFFSPIITIYTYKFGITISFLEWMVLISEVAMLLVMLTYSYLNNFRQRNLNKFKNRIKIGIYNDWLYKNELIEYIESLYKQD